MRKALATCALLCLVSCGGGNGSPTTPTPTTPTAQANRAPVINSISITPAFDRAGNRVRPAPLLLIRTGMHIICPDVGGSFSTASGSVTFVPAATESRT